MHIREGDYYTLSELKARFGVSKMSILNRLKKAGIQPEIRIGKFVRFWEEKSIQSLSFRKNRQKS